MKTMKIQLVTFLSGLVTFVLLAVLVTSCGSSRHAVTSIETHDSTKVEVRTERIEHIDTIYVELPRQVERIVTQDTTSRLENDYAVSEARVEAGMLHHTLETKAAKIPVLSKSTIEKKDSVTTNSKSEVEKEKFYIEKELTAWQKFRLRGFWILAAIIGGYLVWRNRRRLLSLFLRI
nr:MAG TPA: periplasmic binding protein [Caudoviricetes sp.]